MVSASFCTEVSLALSAPASSTRGWQREELVPKSPLRKEASSPKSSQKTFVDLLLNQLGSCAYSWVKTDQEMGLCGLTLSHMPTPAPRHEDTVPKARWVGVGGCSHQKKGRWVLGRHHSAHYTFQTLQSQGWHSHIPDSPSFTEDNVRACPLPSTPPDDFETWQP